MRKRFKIPIITILAIILLVVVVAVWAVKSGWLTRRAEDLANARIPADVGLSVSMGRFTGNVFHRFGIEDIVVTAQQGRDTVVTIDHLMAEYDWRQLWRGEWDFATIAITSMRVYVPPDSTVPYVKSFFPQQTSESVGKATIFDVTVDTFQVTDARILANTDQSALIDSLRLYSSLRISDETSMFACGMDSYKSQRSGKHNSPVCCRSCPIHGWLIR
ncbi:MAG: hypothetical protein GF341_04175 [candidate division Zixibacteria bacterium]|nr:hypothetical protein [candidate division Zixibacteria bacterium]